MDARSVWLPSTIDLDKSHPQRKLRRLATTHRQKCEQTLPQNGRNADGSPQLDSSKCSIHKTEARPPPLPEATEAKLKELRGEKEQDVYISVLDTWTMKNKIYSDQTGNSRSDQEMGTDTSW